MSLEEQIRKDHFEGGSNLTKGGKKGQQDLAALVRELEAEGKTLSFDSAQSAGGGASETLTVDGLLSTDEVLGVAQKTPGGLGTALIGWSNQADGQIDAEWTGDPGAGAVVQVMVKRKPTLTDQS